MANHEVIEHPRWGTIPITRRRGMFRILFKCRGGKLEVTAPHGIPLSRIREGMEKQQQALQKMIDRQAQLPPKEPTLIAGNTIHSLLFPIHIEQGTGNCFRIEKRQGEVMILLPHPIDGEEENIQEQLRLLIKRILSKQGAPYLQQRVRELAHEVGKEVKRVKMGSGRKRLGSCSSQGDITLSCLLLLMPQQLLDYVIYHELAHLTHFDHSAAFHQLCNHYCHGRERELEAELKAFQYPLD